MSSAEAAALVLALMRELAAVRHERNAWRIFALEAVHHGTELQRELAMVDDRRWRTLERDIDEALRHAREEDLAA